MMEEKLNLIDRLHQMVGCAYLSNLKEATYRRKILEAMGAIYAPEYSLQEWSYALSYLFEETVLIESPMRLRLFLDAKAEALEQEAVK